MGFFSSIGLGGSSNIGSRAAEQREIFNREALTQNEKDFGITEANITERQNKLREDFLRQRSQTETGFDPFIQGGEQGIDFLREAGTAGGFNQILSDIIGGGTFQSLRDEQERGARGQAAASGQTGSGAALENLSQISPQLALQLFGDLRGSNQDLANLGFQGVERRGQLGNQLTLGQGQLSSGLTDLESRLRDSFSARSQGLISDIGQSKSSGILGDEQINSQRFNNLLNLIGTAGSFIPGSEGSGSGGGGGTSGGGGSSGIGFGLRNSQGNFF